MKKERLEQLKTIFKSTAKKVFDDGYDNTIRLKETDEYFNVVANQLAYEVKIRTKEVGVWRNVIVNFWDGSKKIK